ncbi:MAG TPA: class I SAM-dependent methyltransferase [Stellaceae bacterium]|nr:class I SAM-dependent methyltransferase [Stellaceae bacterium]
MVADYDSWAEFYDLVEGGRDNASLLGFYGSLITQQTRSLLELGCGTGAITAALSQIMAKCHNGYYGITISGVDVSPEMLRIARTRDRRIEWVEGSFRSPRVSGPYDMVISCFYALQHVLGDDELVAAFRVVRGLLAPQGVFAFDVIQPRFAELKRPQTDRLISRVKDVDGRSFEIRGDWSYDAATRILTLDRRLVSPDESTAPLGRLRYRMRQYLPDEIFRSLGDAGLAAVHRFGDFDRSPFTGKSRNLVVVCRAATGGG